LIVPYQELAPETLTAVIKEYILSQLEDYQLESADMAQWVAQVRSKLHSGEAVVEWSEEHETVTIVDIKKYR
jgi:uncharacterized protein YheU (UPF0270 family)